MKVGFSIVSRIILADFCNYNWTTYALATIIIVEKSVYDNLWYHIKTIIVLLKNVVFVIAFEKKKIKIWIFFFFAILATTFNFLSNTIIQVIPTSLIEISFVVIQIVTCITNYTQPNNR